MVADDIDFGCIMRLDYRPILVLFLAAVCVSGRPSMDSCDWTGSGTLEMALSRGVQPVYLRCTQGTVRWHYPQGALRVVLQHRSSAHPFSACVRRTNSSSGARIYLAGRKRLHPVFSPEDPVDLVKCVASEGTQVTLYMEADPIADAFRRSTAEFLYHLKKVPAKSAEKVSGDCQPCTEDELLHQYCSSDYVIQGAVTNLYHNKELQVTELTVRVSRMHQVNGLHRFPTPDPSSPVRYAVLQRPLACGTKAGSGEYLFLGNWVLGNPSLNCVPRIAEWKKVRRRAIATGQNECVLKL